MDVWLERRLAHVEKAEDVFELFQVEFDPHVLAVHRVHILRELGERLSVLVLSIPTRTEHQRMEDCAGVLRDVYRRFVAFSEGHGGCPHVLAGLRRQHRSCSGGCSAMK
jgi:hypothetical protein